MSSTRRQQLRLEKKRQRRQERLRPSASSEEGRGRRLEQEWAQFAVFGRDGRPADPAHAEKFAALGTMSSALLKLMEPFVPWPPHPSELPEVEAWLTLGAEVWNLTQRATSDQHLGESLEQIAQEWEDWDLPDEDDPVSVIAEVAMRKLQLFATDPRLVGAVRVRAEGGIANVEAVSLGYVR